MNNTLFVNVMLMTWIEKNSVANTQDLLCQNEQFTFLLTHCWQATATKFIRKAWLTRQANMYRPFQFSTANYYYIILIFILCNAAISFYYVIYCIVTYTPDRVGYMYIHVT